jgi:transcription initiation factor TFIIIB Brf1 subunit/transcription initiation factor TFIIB
MTQRCRECKSIALIEEYEGAQLTCTSCGVIGNTETLSKVEDLSSALSEFSIDKSFLIEMAQEFVNKIDIAESMTSLKIMRKRPKRRASNPY